MKIAHGIHLLVVIIGIAVIAGCSTKESNSPPTADFSITPNEGSPLTVFNFDASGCSDEEDLASTLQVRWDWEGDGIFDTDYSTNKILNHQYQEFGVYSIIMEVKDPEGLSNSMTKSLEVGFGSIPAVITHTLTDTTGHSATGGGEVTDIGGTEVTARGVCWNTEPNPLISDYHTVDSLGPGSFTSEITGLLPNTLYYLRAYATNSAGTAYGNELTFTTLNEWICGTAFTVDHIADNVAPVSKTVTYNTAGNIPGEPSKCWITKNLGAGNEATALNDVSESAAGWYWQFNKKQGFKHDGTTRTPAGPWIDPVEENSEWQPSNDPCAIELNDGWRIPTATEWDNISNSGGWTNGTDAWNSSLKLHASGTLKYLDGTVDRRGLIGYFWSSSEFSDADGKSLGFGSDFCQIWGNAKSHGFNIRCIRE